MGINILEQATGMSHGKVILMGEHSVVYNSTAIVIPLTNLTTEVIIDKNSFGQHNIESNQVTESNEGIIYFLNKLNDRFNNHDTFNLKIKSSIPINRGLGSSAALATAIVKAYLNFYQTTVSDNEILDLANIAETHFHGKASGMDVAAVNSNYPIYFSKLFKPQKLSFPFEVVLVVFDSLEEGKTTEAIKLVQSQIEYKNGALLINTLGKLSDQARKAIVNKNINQLADNMNQAQTVLSDLGLSTEKLDKIINLSVKNGALASKITGGGMGGCVISIFNNTEEANNVIKEVKNTLKVNSLIHKLGTF